MLSTNTQYERYLVIPVVFKHFCVIKIALKLSHIHSCAVSCDKLAVQLLFRDASVVSQGTPRCWRGGNGHDLLVCVFMCMRSCFSCINEMCVYCIFLYNLRLYREREREDESQECSLYAIISPRLTAKLSPSLSFIPLRHFPLFFSDQSVSPPSFSSHQLSPHPPL